MPKSAPINPSLNINLLPNDKLEADNNSFLHWALTIGRYVVIATEVIAVGTFLFSIYLSKVKNDLRTDIDRYQATVKSLQTCNTIDPASFCEARFLQIQNQVNHLATVRKTQVKQSLVVNELTKLLPSTLTLDKMTIDGTVLTFSGSFPTEGELQTMVDSFNHSSNITNLNILDLTKDTGFKFNAQADINPAAFESTN